MLEMRKQYQKQYKITSSVFQIRDGSRVKNPMETATWPDTDEKGSRLKYSYKLKTKVNRRLKVQIENDWQKITKIQDI